MEKYELASEPGTFPPLNYGATQTKQLYFLFPFFFFCPRWTRCWWRSEERQTDGSEPSQAGIYRMNRSTMQRHARRRPLFLVRDSASPEWLGECRPKKFAASFRHCSAAKTQRSFASRKENTILLRRGGWLRRSNSSMCFDERRAVSVGETYNSARVIRITIRL